MKLAITLLIIVITFLSACSTYNQAPLTNNNKNNTKITKDSFVKNYKNGEIELYNKEKTELLYNKIIETQEFNPYLLTKSDILNILTTPDLIKTSNHNEMWQYRSSFCIINFIWNNEILNENNMTKIIAYDHKNKNQIDIKQCILFNKNAKNDF